MRITGLKDRLPKYENEWGFVPYASIVNTSTFENTYTVNYNLTAPIGALLVAVVTFRNSTNEAYEFESLQDDAGNIYTQNVSETQSNLLTRTAIFSCRLKNGVTTSNTLTVTATSAVTYEYAQHLTLIELTGVSGVQNVNTAQVSGIVNGSLFARADLPYRRGIVICGNSTGTGTATPITLDSIDGYWNQYGSGSETLDFVNNSIITFCNQQIIIKKLSSFIPAGDALDTYGNMYSNISMAGFYASVSAVFS